MIVRKSLIQGRRSNTQGDGDDWAEWLRWLTALREA
jgi:hypothetical protein